MTWKLYYVLPGEDVGEVLLSSSIPRPRWEIGYRVRVSASGSGSASVSIANPLSGFGNVYGWGCERNVSVYVVVENATEGTSLEIKNVTDNEVWELLRLQKKLEYAKLKATEKNKNSIGDTVKATATGDIRLDAEAEIKITKGSSRIIPI